MKMTVLFCLLVSALSFSFFACEEENTGSKIIVEKISQYKANLPPIPKISEPNVPETYGDSSYSVFGLRKNVSKTINTPVEITAYIVKIYEKPICAEDKTCYTMMPHLYLADDPNESIDKRHIRMVGYAQSFKEMEDERLHVEEGKEKDLPEGVFLSPVVWDWRQGHKYKIKASFTRQSGSGFMDTDGLLEYGSHECLDCPTPEEDEAAKKAEAAKK